MIFEYYYYYVNRDDVYDTSQNVWKNLNFFLLVFEQIDGCYNIFTNIFL